MTIAMRFIPLARSHRADRLRASRPPSRSARTDRTSPYGIAEQRLPHAAPGTASPARGAGTSNTFRVPAKYSPSSARSCLQVMMLAGNERPPQPPRQRLEAAPRACAGRRTPSRQIPRSSAPAINGPIGLSIHARRHAVDLLALTGRRAERPREGVSESAVRQIAAFEHRVVHALSLPNRRQRARQPPRAGRRR